jgi:O-antigen biosynthesis protein
MDAFICYLIKEYSRLGGIPGVCERIGTSYQNYGLEGIWNSGVLLLRNALGRRSYAAWVRKYDSLGPRERSDYKAKAQALVNPPLISVLMPVYQPRMDWLREAVESVRGQIYPHWELCIADDASPGKEVREYLEWLAKEDPRIKVCFRTTNGHISLASNSALEIASGEFVALLDQDDLLREHALLCVAETIAENPRAGVIYSDEDKIEDGRRCDPYFKTDWDPYLMRCHNMICHLGVYRTSLVREIGGFREGFEGAQDWDLALRCVDHLQDCKVVHIPRVLYHWRIHSQSTAMADSGAKPYALEAAQKAIREHLERRGIKAAVELIPEFSMFRVRHGLPEKKPLVSIVIATRDRVDLLQGCIESILTQTSYPEYEIVIVDNGSLEKEALSYLNKLEETGLARVVRDDGEFNFSRLNNRGVSEARGDFVLLLNNDIEVESPSWLSEMVSLAVQSGVGCVGARLWYPDNKLQHAGVILGLGGVAAHSHRGMPRGHYGYFNRACLTHTMSAVTGACLLVKKSLYEDAGGLDEMHLTIGYNDVDFCLKVRAKGYRNLLCAEADLTHRESASRGEDLSGEKRERFRREGAVLRERWGDLLDRDPAYNPNLTDSAEDFGLAFPPRLQSAVSKGKKPEA